MMLPSTMKYDQNHICGAKKTSRIRRIEWRGTLSPERRSLSGRSVPADPSSWRRGWPWPPPRRRRSARGRVPEHLAGEQRHRAAAVAVAHVVERQVDLDEGPEPAGAACDEQVALL